MSKIQAKSVICVVDDFSNKSYGAIFSAQNIALSQKLPLAVVHVIDKPSEEVMGALEKLKTEEERLREFNIPLMVLIGKKTEKLQALKHHIGETIEIISDSKNNSVLERHPYKWPGKVLSVQELIDSGVSC